MKNTNLSPFDMESDSLINFVGDSDYNQEEEIEEDEVILDEEENPDDQDEGDDNNQNVASEDEDISDDDDEVNTSETNPIAILAKSFKEDGILPDDLEIPDDITDVQFAELYRKAKEELIRNDIRAEIMEKEGLNPETLETAKQIHFGVSPKEIETLKLYKGLSSINFDEDADNYEEVVGQYLSLYYKDINFEEALISRQVDRDLASDADELNEVIVVAKKHFQNRAKEVEQSNKDKAAAEEKNRQDKEKEQITKMEGFINSGVIKGVKYSKSDMEKVRKALFDKSEIHVYKYGNKIMVSLYQKRRMEIASDFEYSFKQIVDLVLGPKESKKEIEIEEKAKKSILSELNKASSKPSMSGKSTGGNITKYGEKLMSL